MEKTDPHPYEQDPEANRLVCKCGKPMVAHQPTVMKIQGTARPTKTTGNQNTRGNQ